MQMENFFEVGYLPLLSGIMNDLGLRRKIDECVPVDPHAGGAEGEFKKQNLLEKQEPNTFAGNLEEEKGRA